MTIKAMYDSLLALPLPARIEVASRAATRAFLRLPEADHPKMAVAVAAARGVMDGSVSRWDAALAGDEADTAKGHAARTVALLVEAALHEKLVDATYPVAAALLAAFDAGGVEAEEIEFKSVMQDIAAVAA